MLEGGRGRAGVRRGGGVSFDALNKNIRETNKQKRENKEEDDEEMVRKYHVLMATWDW